MTRDDSDPDQERLQQYCDGGPAPVDSLPPTCDRCQEEGDLTPLQATPPDHPHRRRAQEVTGFTDIREFDPSGGVQLCDRCRQLHQYLTHRYETLTAEQGVSGAVAVFCECHAEDEVDVHPIRRGTSVGDISCSRCGSSEVAVEQLPPTEEINYEVKL